MDPDATLERLLALLRKAQGGYHGMPADQLGQEEAIEFLELFQALHGWMMRGGFPPKLWSDALAFRLDVMKLEAAGTTVALDAGTWGTGWRTK